MPEITFTRIRSGLHTTPVTDTHELVLTNAGGGCGWALALRERATRKIILRLGAGYTVASGKDAATRITTHPRFTALLLARLS